MGRYLGSKTEIKEALKNKDWSFLEYAIDFEKNICELESDVHNSDDPEEIANKTLIAGAEFYDAEWCGVVEVDLFLNKWAPKWWYSKKTKETLERKYYDMKDFTPPLEWIEALHKGNPISCLDASKDKDDNSNDYYLYKKVEVDSYLAFPFWKNPSGFLIVVNPRKHREHIGFLQTVSYVMYSTLNELNQAEKDKPFNTEITNNKDIVINIFRTMEIITSKDVLREEELNSPSIIRLVTYLLLNKGTSHPARLICDAIWPDEIIDNPSKKVKALVYRLNLQLKDMLSDRLIVSTKYGYQLNPELNIITDIQQFEKLWLESQAALSTEAKKELLKKIVEIYKGTILSSASGEHWLTLSETNYHSKYLGSTNELLKIFFEAHDYKDIQKYASQSLVLDSANKEAYLWLILAMDKLGSVEMAKGELRTAEKVLIDEEYQDLLTELKQHDFGI